MIQIIKLINWLLILDFLEFFEELKNFELKLIIGVKKYMINYLII